MARKALSLWLQKAQRNFTIVAEAADRLSKSPLKRDEIGLIVVSVGDGAMPLSALHAKLRTRFRDVPKLILMEGNNKDLAVEALHAGFRGAISMSMDERVVIEALRLVWVGGTSFQSELFLASDRSPILVDPTTAAVGTMASHAADPSGMNARLSLLTARERDVVTRLTMGECNKRIARALSISEHTVKVHVRHILAKLELSNRTQIAVLGRDLT
ncbi:response regulator transcription factor [Marinivivus vitaminiproducens]|uniref:response regulator transcription factor n=1 Tax=Marinivivus vitaminiproducens TaxID=3035935 RepID=UPI0027A56080|nr:response regulator transcription factor [Geminicoccaceae bacterium SCSIO 64248]